jgi:type IV pilus assembly protein PilP
MRFVPVLLVSLVIAASADRASAQQRGQSQPATSAAASAAPGDQQTSKPVEAGAPFTYNPEGRRDPFISLLGRGNDPKGQGVRPPGVPGLLINEVSVKGIVRNSTGFVAMIQGPDNKTYVVKAGDRLMDGSVKSIVQDAVVFSQDVNDPLSLVKQKEIRKALRAAEGGRG